jgi:hypothetical protein
MNIIIIKFQSLKPGDAIHTTHVIRNAEVPLDNFGSVASHRQLKYELGLRNDQHILR